MVHNGVENTAEEKMNTLWAAKGEQTIGGLGQRG